jgi:tetratricopeptide (TPR) repeat protein
VKAVLAKARAAVDAKRGSEQTQATIRVASQTPMVSAPVAVAEAAPPAVIPPVVETKPPVVETPKPPAPVAAKPAPAPVITTPATVPPQAAKRVAGGGTAESHHKTGRALMMEDKFEDAIAELSVAIEMNPNLALAINARGYSQLRLRRYTEALRDFERALALDPSYQNAQQNRAAARRMLGLKD